MGLTPKIKTAHLPESPAVYRIVCIVTGECYIGASANVNKRAYQHSTLLANGDHQSKALQKAYRLHGSIAFRIEIIDTCELAELSTRETAWIQKLNPVFNVNEKDSRIRSVISTDRPQQRTSQMPEGLTEFQRRLWTVGLSQSELARRLKLDRSAVCRWALGRGLPDAAASGASPADDAGEGSDAHRTLKAEARNFRSLTRTRERDT